MGGNKNERKRGCQLMKKLSKFLDRDFNPRLMWLLQGTVAFIALSYIFVGYNKTFSWISITISSVLIVVSVGYGFIKSTPAKSDEELESKQ